jgi:hypothetical protein
VVGILEYGLAKVADLMIKYVITPLINRGQPLSFLEESNQDSAVLKIVPSTESKVCHVLGSYNQFMLSFLLFYDTDHPQGRFLLLLCVIDLILRVLSSQKSAEL